MSILFDTFFLFKKKLKSIDITIVRWFLVGKKGNQNK